MMLARSEPRDGHRVRVLAVHTTEGIMRAVDLRAWTSWAGSSHAAADDTGALLTPADGFVSYDRASWTLRSGNPWSENIELCGFAKWKRADWLARPQLLDACARWLADRSKARDIPLVKLSPKEYRAGKSGVIGHHDHTVGYSDGTHWDPGPGFPWDVVLDKARAYAGNSPALEEDELMGAREDILAAIGELADKVGSVQYGLVPAGGFASEGEVTDSVRKLVYAGIPEGDINSQGEAVKRLRAIHAAAVDTAGLAAALSAQLGDDAAAGQPVSQEMLEAALRNVLGSVDGS